MRAQRIRGWLQHSLNAVTMAKLEDVAEWRAAMTETMAGLLTLLMPVGFAVTFPVFVADRQWWLIGLDVAAWMFAVRLLLAPREPFRPRAMVLVGLVFALMISYFIALGPIHARAGWLVLLAVIGALLLGVGSVVAIVTLNALTLIVIHALVPSDHGAWALELRAPYGKWLMFVVNISLISLAAALPVGFLLNGLDRALHSEKRQRRRLERAETKVRGLNRTLEQRVEQRTQSLEAFTYSVSHDLRAPVRWITGFAQLLEEDEGDRLSAQGRGYVERIGDAARQMGTMIDALLDLSRVERAGVSRERVDVSAMARAIMAELRAGSDDRACEVRIADGCEVHGDPELLRVALDNLLRNAWKFTRNRQDARIEVGVDDDGWLFVRDNGVGFDTTAAEKVFAPFARLHGQEFEGTGVGLATVKRIVEHHGGRIEAVGALDEGATFRFTIPSSGEPGPDQ